MGSGWFDLVFSVASAVPVILGKAKAYDPVTDLSNYMFIEHLLWTRQFARKVESWEN